MADKIEAMLEAEKKLEDAKQEYKNALIAAQSSCDHESVVETNYCEGNFIFRASPPFRTCVGCGYSEEGWGCDYSFLGNKDWRVIREVDRDEGIKYVRGGVISNDVHATIRLSGKKMRNH